uniref:POTRA domain-containing protein n=1 Tax=Synarthrophyton chejuense TaxID=2485825 RepID=A0A3G3MFH9_9FLOR|nr:hypothetical protein [Synarthrophyton chejuense]AYR05589.1 hypothetical protein [Synarthrophyton chejuense]
MNFTKVKEPRYLHNQKNKIQSQKIIKINPYLLIKRNINTIIFKDINSKLIASMILDHNFVYRSFKINSKYNIDKINFIINKLKDSGYFNKIQTFYVFFNNCKYLVIQFNFNSIIKEIIIDNANELKIHNNYLKSLLKKQIGNPKNLQLISNIIISIKHWYFIRGYRWIKVLYKIPSCNTNTIAINIIESKIKRIEIICINNKTKIQDKNLDKFILKTLNVSLSKNLNFYSFESGIIKLKTKRLINHFSYEVKYTSKTNLKVTIKYSCLEKSKSYLFSSDIYSDHRFLNLIYYNLYKNFNNLIERFNNFIYWKNMSIMHLYFKRIDCYLNTQYKNLILCYITNFKNQNKKDKYISQDNYLKFKYYIKLLLIEFEKYNNNNIFVTSYKYTGLKNNFYYNYNLSISIFKNTNKIKKFFLKTIFSYNIYNKIFFDYNNNSSGAIINFTQNLLSNFDICQKINLYNNSYKEENVIFQNKLTKISNFYKYLYYLINIECYKINQQFIDYTIELYSSKLNFQTFIIPRNIFNFYFQVYSPLIIYLEEFSKYNRANHFVNVKYTKIIYLSKNSFNTFMNKFIFSIEFKLFGNFKKFIHMQKSEKNFLLNDNSKKRFKQYFQASLEYYIYKKYNTEIFILFRCKYPYNKYKNKIFNSYIGTGLKIIFPIKQIPIININYELDFNKISRLYAKLYFK